MIPMEIENESKSNVRMNETSSAPYLAAVRSIVLDSAAQRGPSDTPLNIARV
jgi:hypothetical protein